ncbi:uncharacterized protein [Triticum aestivum]|uniref:uncharacterized protein n=1 Tax=Triticum aestivum TaxID=4565 RepID=UPI001D01FDD1|nr:uncharacterized protein LOC123110993 [Triticum aestivum]
MPCTESRPQRTPVPPGDALRRIQAAAHPSPHPLRLAQQEWTLPTVNAMATMGWAALYHTTPRRSDPRCLDLLSIVPAMDPMSPSSPPPLVPPLRYQHRDVQQGDKGARVNALLPSSDMCSAHLAMLQSHPLVAPIIHCVAGVWRSPHLQRGQLVARLVRFIGVRYSLLFGKTKKAL